MEKNNQKGLCKNTETIDYEITEKQIDIFARRLLPEVKKFFADMDIQFEFESWLRSQKTE